MNLIFDLGNVLVTFNPKEFIRDLFPDRPLQVEVAKAIFLSEQWLKIDSGELTISEACASICQQNPSMETDIKYVFKNILDMLVPMNETVSLLPKLKESGHNLYYLSNIGFEARDYLKSSFDFFNYFDGGIFSCDTSLLKPDAKIYQALLDKYNLTAEDCIFFDDMEKNATAASSLGIRGVHFTGADCITSLIFPHL